MFEPLLGHSSLYTDAILFAGKFIIIFNNFQLLYILYQETTLIFIVVLIFNYFNAYKTLCKEK